MKYLRITNNGELDIRLISLMGGTTKSGQSYKIGRFGTGLKYTLAYLVRNNIDFKIFVGEREVKITTEKETISNTEFEIIYIDGIRSSITSMMGADWKGWMIVRELWCNAIDEGGAEKEQTELLLGYEGKTTFYIQSAGEILDTINSWGVYFIEQTPIYSDDTFAVYPPTEHMRLYKNGVLIHENKLQKTVFSYDIKNADINEMREYKGFAAWDIIANLKNVDKKTAELFLNNITEKHYEADNDWSYGLKFKEGWRDAIGQGKIISRKDLDTFVAKGIPIDTAGVITLPENLCRFLSNQFPIVSSVRRADKVSSFHETFDADLELQIKSALAILEMCGYEVNAELKFIYGHFGNKDVFARISIDEKLVMFSVELKNKSRFQIIACIIEENEHYVSGLSDETRAFQQHFINLYTKTLLAKNEVLL